MKKFKGEIKFNCSYGEGLKDKNFTYLTNLIKNEGQREVVVKWIKERNSLGLSVSNTRTELYRVIHYANYHNKDFLKISKEDNIKYFEEEKLSPSLKKRLKRFLKWCNGDQDYPENIKWLKIKQKVEDTPEEKDPLTDDEAKAIIENTCNMRDRVVLGIMADEFPVRSIEMRHLKTKDIIFDDFGIRLKIYSKTPSGRREIRLINSLPDFKTYWKTYPFKDDPEHPLFYSVAKNSFGMGISWGVIKSAINGSIKRAKLRGNIKSHDFRKYVATKLLTNPKYTTMEVKKMGGWSGIQILDTYSKVTSKMVTDKAAGLNGKGEKIKLKVDPLRPKPCPYCAQENSPLNDYCDKCNKPITAKGFDKEEKTQEEKMKDVAAKVLSQLTELPELEKALKMILQLKKAEAKAK